jgi:hypothetical protein
VCVSSWGSTLTPAYGNSNGPHRTNGRERRNGAAESAEGNPVARGLLADAAATGQSRSPQSADRSECHAKGTPVRDHGTNGAQRCPRPSLLVLLFFLMQLSSLAGARPRSNLLDNLGYISPCFFPSFLLSLYMIHDACMHGPTYIALPSCRDLLVLIF